MAVRRTTLLIDADLLERLDRHAHRAGTTKTAVVAQALEAWLEAHARTGIDIYVVDRQGVRGDAWARSFPVAPTAGADTIFSRNRPSTERCTIASERNLALVDAACFEEALGE